MTRFIMGILACLSVVFLSQAAPKATSQKSEERVRLGNFSVSLTVKDLAASKAFYEKLGFREIGIKAKAFTIMQNETATIGLFQGILEKNVLTFNPGWDRNTKTLPDFDDVRDIQKTLVGKGLELMTKADESSTGPASFILSDPDGNRIFIDQHIPKPKKK